MKAGKNKNKHQVARNGMPSMKQKTKPIKSQWARIPKKPTSGFGKKRSLMIFS
tara:strand:+ start:1271 stop:1429 length:159 start_codon:yes stop_codon:yes gene_type:complete